MGRRGGVVALAIAIWSPETPLSGDPLNTVLRFKPRPTSVLMFYPHLNHAHFLFYLRVFFHIEVDCSPMPRMGFRRAEGPQLQALAPQPPEEDKGKGQKHEKECEQDRRGG